MPLFMDVRTIGGGVSTADAVQALEGDLATQGRHGVSCLRYWVSEAAGKVFCLVEADDLDLAMALRRPTRGLVAEEVYPVNEHAGRRSKAGRSDLERPSTKG